ncbi:MAG: peptide chain release factor 1 [candidate division WOR-3 bacterium]|nr:peptide chain release factor 1 [candidate division WOR-3 bacterium]
MEQRLVPLKQRYTEIEQLLADPKVLSDSNQTQSLSKEYKDIKTILQTFEAYKATLKEIEDTKELRSSSDEEIKEMAEKELVQLERRRDELRHNLLYYLVPKDPSWKSTCIVEIRAAAGGEESALFAAELFRMYTKYIEKKNLRYEVLSSRPSDLQGYKEIIFSVEGEDAFRYFRFESGVHRVQRVPITEASGRLHTSTVTVAVLPEPTEIELKIDPQDLKIEVFRAGGHGGQHVNVTDSAVRITHIPTGIVVSCQDERSQLKNKNRAMKILRARVLELKKAEEEKKLGAQRRSQIGSGDRSEKIRTYNYPQNRVTDHRIGLSVHNLPEILDGELDYIVHPLEEAEITKQLQLTK